MTCRGFVGLLDEHHQPLGERQACRISWSVDPGSWAVQFRTQHKFDLQAFNGAPSYLAIYAGDDGAERMFTLPLVNRPVRGAVLYIGV
jgi:hypothetical protein